MSASYPNSGHGHVYPRPDGVRARCGGARMCRQCQADAARQEAETEGAVHAPRRGSDVETWIRGFRDAWPVKSDKWWAVDELLDDYRLHSDVGRPLTEHACDAPNCCESENRA